MAGYTKLFSTILDSTIWLEDLHIKVTWITMLAMADKNGVIEASIPGLAKRAGVTIPQCEEAITKFKSPDIYSKNPDFEGRRIDDTPGGWQLLNHAYYRKLEQEEAERERKRLWWEQNKGKKTAKLDGILANTSDDSTTLAKTSFPDSDPDPNSDPDLIKNKTPKPPKGPSKDFLDWYEFYPNKKARATAYKTWKNLKKQNLLPDLDVLVSAIKKQTAARLAKKTAGGFVPEWPNPSTWLNGERWLDESEDNTEPKPPPPRNYGMNDWS